MTQFGTALPLRPMELDLGFRSEPQSDTTGEIELVEVVIIAHDPAPAPEWIAPISAIRGSEVCGGPLDLTAKTKMIADVVFRTSAKSKCETSRTVDATAVGRQVTGS